MAGSQPKFINTIIRAAALALIIVLITSASCEEKNNQEFVKVQLEIPISIKPGTAIISLQDTLWVEADFPDTIHDYLSKEYLKVVDCDFYTSLGLINLISKSLNETSQPAAAGAFDFISATGSISKIGSLSGELAFVYEQGRYKIKIGLIPKFKGIFSMRLFLREVSSTVPVLDSPRSNKVYTMTYVNYILNDGNFHFELYENNVKTISGFSQVPDFDRIFNVYSFEVR
jgi:hypothetical protein